MSENKRISPFLQQQTNTTLKEIGILDTNEYNITYKEAKELKDKSNFIKQNYKQILDKKIKKFDLIFISIIIILSILLIIFIELGNINRLFYLIFLILPISFIGYYIKRKQIKKSNLEKYNLNFQKEQNNLINIYKIN